MKILILGICGTFMGGVAKIAQQLGYIVDGYDTHIYPPMSDQLQKLDITIFKGNELNSLELYDEIIIGNSFSRGNPIIEEILDRKISYTSGPKWLFDHVLKSRKVVAISGTHGKTTVTSMVSWIAREVGNSAGYLIGGLPKDFEYTADLGKGEWFIIEADEYDSMFCDKRSKFLHYFPHILLINNIEFDHGDIFNNLNEIKKQFHILVRTVPRTGTIIYPNNETNINEVLDMGCWSEREVFQEVEQTTLNQKGFYAHLIKQDGSNFTVNLGKDIIGEINWKSTGSHNVNNALAAITTAKAMGIAPKRAISVLSQFSGVKRRLEIFHTWRNLIFYDDFAHHPTAIRVTLSGLKNKISSKKLIVIVGASSYTMQNNFHKEELSKALSIADEVFIANKQLELFLTGYKNAKNFIFSNDPKYIVNTIYNENKQNTDIVVISSRGVTDLHEQIIRKFK